MATVTDSTSALHAMAPRHRVPRTRAPRSPADERRAQILEVALRLFRAQGVERTSLRQVSEALGLSKSGLYHHFAAKDELVDALVTPLLDDTEALLAGAPPVLDEEAGGRRDFLAAYLDVLLDHRTVVAWVGRDRAATSTRPHLHERVLDLDGRLRDRLAGTEPDTPARIRAAYALIGMQAAVVYHGADEPDVVRDVALRAAAETLRRD